MLSFQTDPSFFRIHLVSTCVRSHHPCSLPHHSVTSNDWKGKLQLDTASSTACSHPRHKHHSRRLCRPPGHTAVTWTVCACELPNWNSSSFVSVRGCWPVFLLSVEDHVWTRTLHARSESKVVRHPQVHRKKNDTEKEAESTTETGIDGDRHTSPAA